MGELLDFLGSIIDLGGEIHLVDMSDPKNPVEHVYKKKVDCSGYCDSAMDCDDVPFEDDSCPYDGACNDCPYENECADDLDAPFDECDDEEPPFWGVPDVRRIVFSGPATIVFWEDDTKTVVKCMEGEKFERYAGFAAACMKKMFGSTSRAKAIMEEVATEEIPKESKKSSCAGEHAEALVIDERPGVDHETIMEAVDEALNG